MAPSPAAFSDESDVDVVVTINEPGDPGVNEELSMKLVGKISVGNAGMLDMAVMNGAHPKGLRVH